MGDRLRRVMGVVRSMDAVWPRLAISRPMRTWGAWMVVVAVLGFPLVASGADPLLRFRTETFSETTDLGALPKAVRLRLAQFAGEQIANSDESFHAIDVIEPGEGDLPWRRLIRGGSAEDLTFVEYEHGGQAPREHFVLFRTIGSQATLIKACRGYLPTDLEKLKKVVGTSACRWRSKEH